MSEPLNITIPRHNANDDEVEVVKILVDNGEFIKKNTPLIEVETSKINEEIVSSYDGYIQLLVEVGQEVEVDSIFATISDNPHEIDLKNVPNTHSEKNGEQMEIIKSKIISNKAKSTFSDDEIKKINSPWISTRSLTHNDPDVAPNDLKTMEIELQKNKFLDKDISIDFDKVKLGKRKEAEIKNLSKSAAGQFQSCIGININASKRNDVSPVFSNSIQDLIVYESFKLLSNSYADLNAFFIDGRYAGKFKEVIPGIAFDNGSNLTVLSIGHESLNKLTELQSKIINLILIYEDNKISRSNLNQTTYTVTDLSSTDSSFILPLLNGYQSLIIAITKSKSGFNLYCTFDHRITEGLRISNFLKELKNRVESFFYESKQDDIDKKCYFCERTLEAELAMQNRGLLKLETIEGTVNCCNNCFSGG